MPLNNLVQLIVKSILSSQFLHKRYSKGDNLSRYKFLHLWDNLFLLAKLKHKHKVKRSLCMILQTAILTC